MCVACGGVFDVPKSFLSCGLCALRWMVLLPSRSEEQQGWTDERVVRLLLADERDEVREVAV